MANPELDARMKEAMAHLQTIFGDPYGFVLMGVHVESGSISMAANISKETAVGVLAAVVDLENEGHGSDAVKGDH